MSAKVKSIILYSLISGTSASIYSMVFNLFLRNNGLTNSIIGNFTSLELYGSAIIGTLLGVFGSSLGKKRIIVATACFSGLIMLLRAFFPYPDMLIYTAFLNGGMGVARNILLNVIILELTDNKTRARAFGYNAGVSMGSGLIGNIIGGYLGDIFGLKFTLIVAGISFVLSTLVIINLSYNDEPVKIKTQDLLVLKGLDCGQKRIVIGYVMTTAFVGFGAGLFINFGNLIFYDLFKMSPAMIGAALSVAQLGTAIGSFYSHKLSEKFGAVQYSAWMQFLVIPLVMMLGYIRDPYLFTACYALRYSLMNMTSPVTSTIIFSALPKERVAIINSLSNFMNNIVRGVASGLFGIIVSSGLSGYKTLFLISAVFYILNIIMYLWTYFPIRNSTLVTELYKKENVHP
jgi:MFS family permease